MANPIKISLDKAPGIEPSSFEEQLAARNQELKEKFTRVILRLFAISNLVVLLALAVVYNNDQSIADFDKRLITSEVLMAMIGATTVQVGAIMLTIANSMFPKE